MPEEWKGRFITLLKNGNFIKEEHQATTSGALTKLIATCMRELDFLYTEQLVFNYKDYKGEPGQAIYDADLFVLGESIESKPDIITFLESKEFEDKRLIYTKLFNVFKDLSVCILPSKDGSNLLPTTDELENELTLKRDEYFSGTIVL